MVVQKKKYNYNKNFNNSAGLIYSTDLWTTTKNYIMFKKFNESKTQNAWNKLINNNIAFSLLCDASSSVKHFGTKNSDFRIFHIVSNACLAHPTSISSLFASYSTSKTIINEDFRNPHYFLRNFSGRVVGLHEMKKQKGVLCLWFRKNVVVSNKTFLPTNWQK